MDRSRSLGGKVEPTLEFLKGLYPEPVYEGPSVVGHLPGRPDEPDVKDVTFYGWPFDIDLPVWTNAAETP